MNAPKLRRNNPFLRERIRAVRLIAFDFDGVFTDNKVYVFQDGSEAVCCFRGDGLGLEKLKRLGVQTVVISTEVNPVVAARAAKLGIRCLPGCRDKRVILEQVAGELGLTLQQVAFVGNDINDKDCLSAVGLPIVVRDAHPDVMSLALYRTRVLGGQGAVREICDLFADILEQAPGADH